MQETTYYQPFLHLSPWKQYPEIHDLVFQLFPSQNLPVKFNLYAIFAAFLTSPAIAVSRTPRTYRSFKNDHVPWYTHAYATRAQDLLAERKLVIKQPGFRARPGYRAGFSTVLLSTPTLDALLDKITLEAVREDPENHPVITLDRIPLKASDVRRDTCLNPEQDLVSRAVLEDAFTHTEKLNKDYFGEMTLGFEPSSSLATAEGMTVTKARAYAANGGAMALTMATNVFFTAMFTSNGGGRLYQRCNSFQCIPKNLRRFLTINEKPTLESDYSGMHLNLAYALNNKKNPFLDDVYTPILESLGLERTPTLRDAVKHAVLVAMNTPNMGTAKKAMLFNYRQTHVQALKEAGVSVEQVYDHFFRVHKDIKTLFAKTNQKAELFMFSEGKILRRALTTLAKEGIRGIPLHDELIHEAVYNSRVEEVMRESYQRETGFDIYVKTS